MRLRRVALTVACCALSVAAFACGGGGDDDPSSDLDNVPTATMPAELPTPLAIGESVPTGPDGASTYVIRSGDTFATIAERFGVTLEELIEANPSIDPRSLTVGATVRLPGEAGDVTPEATPADEESTPTEAAATDTPVPEDTPAPEPTPTVSSLGQTYIVVDGDIPVTIAAQFGITVEALLAANPGLDPTGLNIGDVLIIPPPPEPAPEGG